MFDSLFIVSIVGNIVQAIKTACTPTIPVENIANKNLYYKDIINGASVKQCMENIKNGKYKLTEAEFYSEPHRNPKNGKVMIENRELYFEDLKNYGASQTQYWAERGKYNLS